MSLQRSRAWTPLYFGIQSDATRTPKPGNRCPLYEAHCSLLKSYSLFRPSCMLTGQESVLQLLKNSLLPMQYFPPCWGAGLLHWRLAIRTPPPQVLEQEPNWLQLPHPPSMGSRSGTFATHLPFMQWFPGAHGDPSARGKFFVWHWLARLQYEDFGLILA